MDSVSVVIPTINEAENIGRLVPLIEEVFSSSSIRGEVIVVDDGSSDGTAEEARILGKRYGNVRVVERTVRDGLGNALKRGVSEAAYGAVVFMDADLSHEPKEIPNFLRALGSHDVVVGSRFMRDSSLKRGLPRKIISGTYNFAARNILGVKVGDLTSGYRAFRKDAFISLGLESPGPEIHSELVVKASIAGLRVGEIPVSYADRVHGESKLNYASIGPGYARVIVKGFLAKAAKFLRHGC
jgi:dolichol-phosphate mannosyltransferase